MIHHVSLNVSDFGKSKEFYTKALAPLGYGVVREFAEWNVAGLGEPNRPDTWIHGVDEVKEKTHVAYVATSKAQVEAFHSAALAAGGKDNGAPGYRKEYTPGYYAAFAHDPDGHNIEVVFMDPNPTE